ncbi:MAG: GNAT family N-acetyltransferase [Hasllibacter sp.]
MDLSRWTPRALPPRAPVDGLHCRLEPVMAGHAAGLHAAFAEDPSVWDHLPIGPFDAAGYAAWVAAASGTHDPMHMAVLVGGAPLGTLSTMRMDPANGVAEVGWITYSKRLQRTPAATEAVVLLARAAFGLGYRRFEWKCDAANLPSRRAAQRFGFSHEGTFRQAAVVKGRNRDTAWFAMIDAEFPALDAAWTAWLDPANFDAGGGQRTRLSRATAPLLAARDPAI